jgi:hypothetical protein
VRLFIYAKLNCRESSGKRLTSIPSINSTVETGSIGGKDDFRLF